MVGDKSEIHTTAFSERRTSIENAKITFEDSPAMGCSGLRPTLYDNIWNVLQE